MKSIFFKYKKIIFSVLVIIVIIAGLLDLKFEGLFYQLLPQSAQSYFDRIL